ncbi:YbaK/EbsC protein [Propionibacterium sp. oral taxon 192 str. F0372]|uniref:Cys-tRNA(Pro) deacylase n=1 Tax=Propionibacterium sp. oral taxon 192 TaxID=671222 RepID=UPI000352F61B|nr:Cys-tRNA(Pro) deacylase [Propionibacterium sp. oral taxon 192]EPH02733.1 YbaK/EbsC protein [Propionibacterium sp. oral taxon 192 str. F0372]
MAGTPALRVLDKAKVPYRVHIYEHDPSNRHFGEETAATLGIAAERIFKTLIAELVGATSATACAVVPVSGQLDLKALASATGAKKAAMIDPVVAQRLTGYVVGGISPLGQKKPMPVCIDTSAQQWSAILVSGGRRGLSIEMSPTELARILGASFARLGRPGTPR